MEDASAMWPRVLAMALTIFGGAVPSCKPRALSGVSVEDGRVAVPGALGTTDGGGTAPAPLEGGAPATDTGSHAGCPPDVAGGRVPSTDGEDSVFSRTVPLTAPREPRTVVVRGVGATMTFGLDEFAVAARCLGMKLVSDYLATRPAGEQVVALSDAEAAASISSQAQFVVAALLDRGHARVREHASQREVDSIVRDRWSWMGCGGDCRQRGREYRLRVPGEVFYRTTDLFADALRLRAPPDGTSPRPGASD